MYVTHLCLASDMGEIFESSKNLRFIGVITPMRGEKINLMLKSEVVHKPEKNWLAICVQKSTGYICVSVYIYVCVVVIVVKMR